MPLSNPFFFLLNIDWGNVNVKGSLLKNIFVIYINKGFIQLPSISMPMQTNILL